MRNTNRHERSSTCTLTHKQTHTQTSALLFLCLSIFKYFTFTHSIQKWNMFFRLCNLRITQHFAVSTRISHAHTPTTQRYLRCCKYYLTLDTLVAVSLAFLFPVCLHFTGCYRHKPHWRISDIPFFPSSMVDCNVLFFFLLFCGHFLKASNFFSQFLFSLLRLCIQAIINIYQWHACNSYQPHLKQM